MSSARFDPSGPLRGDYVPPADKSISHRAALFGAIALAYLVPPDALLIDPKDGKHHVNKDYVGKDASVLGQAAGVRMEEERDESIPRDAQDADALLAQLHLLLNRLLRHPAVHAHAAARLGRLGAGRDSDRARAGHRDRRVRPARHLGREGRPPARQRPRSRRRDRRTRDGPL